MQLTGPGISVGIDFGTSNTVVALADAAGHVETLRFEHGGAAESVFATALSFWQERVGREAEVRIEGGPWAIERYLNGEVMPRFLQSFKSFAASATFRDTRIFGETYRFEDLLVTFMETVTRHAGGRLSLRHGNLTVGRPVRFAGGNPDDGLAMTRYRTAFEKLGAGAARYAYEPVGAAFFFARDLKQDATVLVADFGGGTSDFSVIRFSRAGGRLSAEALGHAGVGIAGDSFDYRIVDKVVSPRLGKGGSYRSFGKVLPLPGHYYANFARWNQLALMKSGRDIRDLKELARTALDPDALERLIEIVENDYGFMLYRAVGAAKIALSAAEEVPFRFKAGSVAIETTVARRDFEAWIAEDVARLSMTVDKALGDARLVAGEIDKVFLTGGSSFIPAIRRIFAERFGEERLVTASPFESIAAGLALLGQSDDIAAWTL